MKKAIKNAIAIIMCLAICLSLAPSQVLAAAKPAPPKSIKSTAVSTTSLKLSWNKVSKAKKYTVYMKSGSKYRKLADVKKNAYTVKKLKAGTKNAFKVAVTTKNGTSKQSAVVYGYTKCAAPTTIKAGALSKTSVKVTWKASKGAQKYRVYASTKSSGSFWYAGETKSKQFTVKGLGSGTKYYFKVTAINGNAESKYSKVASAKTQGTVGEVAPSPTPTKPPAPGTTPTPTKPPATAMPTPTGGNPTPTPTPWDGSPTGVTVSVKKGDSPYIPVTGGSCTLTTTIQPANSTKNTAIAWSSGNANIAAVDQNGKVTAKGAGDAVITATTANGKKGSFTIKVAPDVQSISFVEGKYGKVGGIPIYVVDAGESIPVPEIQFTPANAYNVVTVSSSDPTIAVTKNSDGRYFIKGINADSWDNAVVTVKTHNNKEFRLVVWVNPVLTEVRFFEHRTQKPNLADPKTVGTRYWLTREIGTTPGSNSVMSINGKSVPILRNYTVSSLNPDVATIESVLYPDGVTEWYIHPIAPGNAELIIEWNGAVQDRYTIKVVEAPPKVSTTPKLQYLDTVYSPNDRYPSNNAAVKLNITEADQNFDHQVVQFVRYDETWTEAQLFAEDNIANFKYVPKEDLNKTLTIHNVSPGRRHFGIRPSGQGGHFSVLTVAALYYPRQIGGLNTSDKAGCIVPSTYPVQQWNAFTESYFTYYFPCDPFKLNLSFLRISGAEGYDIVTRNNGGDIRNFTIIQPSGSQPSDNICFLPTGAVYYSGITEVTITPYVTYKGSKILGATRTVIFDVNASMFDIFYYWETSQSVNSPTVTFVQK